MSTTPVCPECGSENILNDAWATWNSDTGEWELATTFDNGYCEDCDGPISSFEWVEKKIVSKLGYDVFKTERGFVIQADDEVGAYLSDRDARIACINDTLYGNTQSAEMLKRVLVQCAEKKS